MRAGNYEKGAETVRGIKHDDTGGQRKETECNVDGRGKDGALENCLLHMAQIPVRQREGKMQETVQMCIREMRRQSYEQEERTGFWTYLSDIFRMEGAAIFGLQVLALLVICLGILTAEQRLETLPAFMPLFGLALIPVLYRNQAYGMCEIEAVTRASGAQIILAKLILAGAANMLCMTVIVCLEGFLVGDSGVLMQVVLYAVVPFLVCAVELLRRIRICRHRGIPACAAMSLVFCMFWGASAKAFPWLYEASAMGIWAMGFVVFAAFFIREICFIIQTRREGKMYGTID
ncbi:MAG: hypothetical protein NC416_18190 [Eubacterium sp.]|nr:hypothetical protein [Eubacterium sp.]